MNRKLFLAIDLGGTKTSIGCFRDHILLGSTQFSTPQLAKDFEILIESQIRLLLTRLDLHLEEIQAIGVGAAGVWDENNILKQSIHLSKYIDQPIWDNISSALEVPVYLRTDVELAALGEALAGQENKYESLLYINLGTGFSAGFFKDGQLFTSNYSPTLRLEYMVQPDFNANTLSSRATIKSPERKEIIASLSTTLVNLACILVPQIIVLGGGKTKDDNWDLIMRPAVDKALEYLDQHMTYSIKIIRTKLESPTLYGAYELALAADRARSLA